MKTCFSIQDDFPLLKRRIEGHPLVYLDNAATSLKPQVVVDSLVDFYSNYGVNIHRGIYTIAEETTLLYEQARTIVADFIGAYYEEIIFTKGATESINLVASTWALDAIKPGDQIVITAMEHHANFVPWQQVADRTGSVLKVVPINSDGTLVLNKFEEIVGTKTKMVAVCHVSNLLGVHNDISTIIKIAHKVGAKVLIDAAQSAPHQKIDVRHLDCDFLVFSGHKLMGPTGVGVLYAKKELLECMRPYQYGGGMILKVNVDRSTWQGLPQKFEAGTPPIASAIGLGVAIQYFKKKLNFDDLKIHEASLCKCLIEGLATIKNVTIYGPTDQLQENGHIVSFTIRGLHPHDVAAYCDRFGICIRAGLQCAHPLTEFLAMGPTVRVSTFAYNTQNEIEYLLTVLEQMTKEMESIDAFEDRLHNHMSV